MLIGHDHDEVGRARSHAGTLAHVTRSSPNRTRSEPQHLGSATRLAIQGMRRDDCKERRGGDPLRSVRNGRRSDAPAHQWARLAVHQLRRRLVREVRGAGFAVTRFDNRDTGLSSKLDGVQYTLRDMAGDTIAVLDTLGVARAHVLGVSMGGMIVQRLAIDQPDRVLSMTSVMSRTGEPEYGQSTPEALAFLTRKPAASRARSTSTPRSPQCTSTARNRNGSTKPTSTRVRARRTTAASTRPASRGRCRRSRPTDRAPTRCARCASLRS